MSPPTCKCFAVPFKYLKPVQEPGLDSRLAEVSIQACQECGQFWLTYFYEMESFTGSGRWYLGPISPEQRAALTLESAKSVLEGLDWYIYGGSYFNGRSGRGKGAILLP